MKYFADEMHVTVAALVRQFTSQSGSSAEKTIVEIINTLRTCLGDDEINREAQELFLEFMQDKIDLWKQFPKLSVAVIDSLLDSLLLVCNQNPSPVAAHCMMLFTQMLMEDIRVFNRFRATKVNLMKLCLPLYIQGTDANLKKQALDFVVYLLPNSPSLDMDDLSTDPAVVSKVTWAERRQAWTKIKAHESSLQRVTEAYGQQESLVGNLNRIIAKQETMIDQLHAEIEALKTKSLSLEVSNNELKRLMERQAEVSTENRAVIETQDNRLAEVERVIKNHHENIVLLNETTDGQEGNIQRLAKSVKINENGFRTLESNVNTHSSMLKVLETSVADQENTLEKVKVNNDTHETMVQRHDKEVKHMSAVVADMQAMVEGNDAQLQSASSNLRTISTTLSEIRTVAESNKNGLDIHRTSTEKNVTSLKQEMKGQEAALHHLRVETGSNLTTLKSTARALEGTISEVQNTVELQSAAISRLMESSRSVEELQKRERESSDLLARLKDEFSSYVVDMEKISSTTAAHQQTLRDMLAATEATSAQIDALQSTVEGVEGSMDELWRSSSQTSSALKEMSSSVDRQSSSVRGELDAISPTLRNVENAVSNILSQMRNMESAMSEMGRQLDTHEQNSTRLRGQIEREIGDLKAALSENAKVRSTTSRDVDGIMANLRAVSDSQANRVESMQTQNTPLPPNGYGSYQNTPVRSNEPTPYQTPQHTQAGAEARASTSEVRSGKNIGVDEAALILQREAESKFTELSRGGSGSVAARMEAILWIAEHLDYLSTSRVWDALDDFHHWANANAATFKRSHAGQPALIEFLAERVSSGSDMEKQALMLGMMECAIKSDSNLQLFDEAHGPDRLNGLLGASAEDVIVGTMRVLRASTRNQSCILQIKNAGTLRRLIGLLASPSERIREHAAATVRSCTRLDEVIPDIQRSGGIPALISLLQSNNETILEHASGALRNCARLDTSVSAMQLGGAFPLLVAILRSKPNVDIQKCASGALRSCAKNLKAQQEIQSLGGMDLIDLRYPMVRATPGK
jgi:hypothetical protein